MSQNSVDFPNSDPSGVTLLDDLLPDFQQNVETLNSGTSRPSYVRTGMMWLDITTNPWVLKVFQGSDDIIVGELNTVDKDFTPSGVSELVNDTSPQLGGDLDSNSNQIQMSKGADVASASALAILTDGNYYDVTGTTPVTSINTTGRIGTVIKLHFDAVLTLTHHATNLILPGGANIVTAAGDEAEFVEYASGDFRCTNYMRASGLPIISTDIPVGAIIDFATSTLQTNFLPCDGAAVSRTTYAGLFAAIGTTWGSGDGSTTFNLPSSARRTKVGSGGSGTGTLGNAVGNTGGSETHTLSTSELNHTTATVTNVVSNSSVGPVIESLGAVTSTASAHNNMQPSMVVSMQIKYR